jgi:hypothetical protein
MSPHGKVVYEPGLMWAEPNTIQAARWMRFLYDHPEERTRIARSGTATVRNQFNPATVANIVADRLVQIRGEAFRSTTAMAPVPPGR